eukprot:gene16986-biopygen17156
MGRLIVEVQPVEITQHLPGVTVLHHERLAFVRRIDVQRHVHRRALEDGQLADQQVDGTWQRDGHAVARFYTLVDQIVGQAIGPQVEFAVRQRHVAVYHRQRVGAGQDAGFEDPVHGVRSRVGASSGVEIHQHLMPLGGWQDRHLMQRCGRRLLQCRDQVAQGAEHVVADALHIHLRHALHGQGKACAEVVDVQHQRVVAALLGTEDFDPGVGERAGARRFTRRAVAVVEQGAEQRQRTGHATASLGQGQGRMFMPQQLCQPRMGGAHASLHAHRADTDPQRQGIDEHSQRPVGALAAVQPAQQHGAEDHVVLARDLAEDLGPCQVHQACGTHPQLPGLLAKAQAEGRFQCHVRFAHTAAVAVHVLQAEGQGRLVDVAEHFAEERLMLRSAHTEARLGHVVAVLHGVGQQAGFACKARAHFLHQHLQRGVVQQDVVQQQDADVTALILGVGKPHQRSAGQVEAVVAWVEAFLQLRQYGTERIGFNLLNHQQRLAQDHLHRLVQAFPDNPGTQDIVALDHTLQRTDKRLDRLMAAEAELHLQHVGIAFGGCQVVVQDAGLQRGQAVDVLHVGDAAGDTGDDMVDGLLVEIHQRQHVRGDVPRRFADQVGRDLHFMLPAHRSGQRSQGRLAEQHPHIGAQLELAHALDQLDRQQRMAAQLEKVVLAPDPVDLEQVLPEIRDRGFHRALWRFITTTGQGIGVRCRQGLAVELAVGGKRERVEQHKGAGHHVLGEGQQQVVTQLSGSGRVFRLGNHVGHQALVARFVFAGNHHGFAHTFAGGQACFDFPQFDTETANLHLVVVAPQVLDTAVGQHPAEVTGLVQAQAGCGIRQKTFGRQLIAVEITPRHAGTADVQLPDYAARHRFAAGVQHIQLQVGNAHANRAHAHPLCIRRLQGTVGHMHGGFGDAIHVDQPRTGVGHPGVPRLENPRFQGFTAEDHLAQRVQLLAAALCRDQLAERARRLVENTDAGFAQQCVTLVRRAADQLRHHQQLPAMHQRAPDLPHGEVEGKRVEQRPGVIGVELEPMLGGAEQSRDVAVFDHHALGQAGGAGGVDHIGKAGRADCNVGVDDGLVLQAVEVDRRDVAHQVAGVVLHQHRQRRAVFQGVGDTVQRVGRIDRHITRPSLENPQQANDHFQPAFDTDRHPVIGADAMLEQAMRNLVGALVQLAVAQVFVFKAQRDGFGMAGGMSFDLLVDQG